MLRLQLIRIEFLYLFGFMLYDDDIESQPTGISYRSRKINAQTIITHSSMWESFGCEAFSLCFIERTAEARIVDIIAEVQDALAGCNRHNSANYYYYYQ